MIPLFRRHFWITLALFAVILLMGSFLSNFLTRMEHRDFFGSQVGLYQTIIDKHPGDKRAYAQEINAYNEANDIPVRLHVEDSAIIGEERTPDRPRGKRGPPGLFGPLLFMIKNPKGPPPEAFTWARRLPSDPKLMLVIEFPPPPDGPRSFNMLITMGVMFLSVGFASALSLLILFRNFREKAELAKNVIGRLQHGDLKARFPIGGFDESQKMFKLFNEMADEIERLVEQLKNKEQARVQLLQELAHDLRTPVASLKALLETLQDSAGEKDKEMHQLAFQESEYLGRLVEDLLLLALMFEPKYKMGSGDAEAKELILSQINLVQNSCPHVRMELKGEVSSAITGSPHLLKRMVRNALENACSFARSKVQISLREHDGLLTIEVLDDGPGLSAEALETFGKKRPTRYQDPGAGRISVGLGSVIMQAIAQAHGGQVAVTNVTGADGKPAGAKLTITIRSDAPQAA